LAKSNGGKENPYAVGEKSATCPLQEGFYIQLTEGKKNRKLPGGGGLTTLYPGHLAHKGGEVQFLNCCRKEKEQEASHQEKKIVKNQKKGPDLGRGK